VNEFCVENNFGKSHRHHTDKYTMFIIFLELTLLTSMTIAIIAGTGHKIVGLTPSGFRAGPGPTRDG
jgi:hypothetical protein